MSHLDNRYNLFWFILHIQVSINFMKYKLDHLNSPDFKSLRLFTEFEIEYKLLHICCQALRDWYPLQSHHRPFSHLLLICKCAKLTSLSIKIKTTLAKEEIGQILRFVCKHEEHKYTNGSSMNLHYGPLQVLKIIQGAISSKVEYLPRIPLHTPFLSGEFQSKIFSTEKGFWNDFYFLTLAQVLAKH